MKVILISGKAQSGKDTTAKQMREILTKDGHRVLVTHYADLLKYICKNYFNWDGQKDEQGRRMLQYVGTDVIRKQNPTLWVDFVSMILRYFHENWEYVIIPDCRFPNEVEVMKSNFDAIHVRVVRPNFDGPLNDEQKKHPSETALDNYPYDELITNNSNVLNLGVNIIDLASRIDNAS
jgi:hypothetical protein